MKHFSHHIIRKDACQKVIDDYLKKYQSEEKNFMEFEKAWAKISKLATRFDCKALPEAKIDKNSELAYILPCKFLRGRRLIHSSCIPTPRKTTKHLLGKSVAERKH